MAIKATLRRAFTLHFLLLATLPILIFGVVAITLLQNQTVADLNQRNQQLAKDISEEADDFLYEVLLDLQHVRNVFVEPQLLEPGSEDRFLEMTVNNSQFFEAIYILDDQRRARYLGLSAQLLLRKEDYRNLDFSAHALFQSHPVMKAPTWSDSFVSLVTGEPSVTLALPLRDGWMVLGNISLERCSAMLQRYTRDDRSQFAIVDHQGTLIAHSDANLAMQRINLSNHPEIRKILNAGSIPLPEAEHTGNLLESVARITVSDWVVWAAADMDYVMAPLHRLRDILVGFMLVAIAVASGLALLNSRRLMQPLAALTARAGQVAEGKYELGFRVSGFMEIDELAENFRSMSLAVKERETSILNSEKRFRDLVNSIDGIVWEADFPAMQFLFVSRQAEAILGYPVRQWLDEDDFWAAHIHPDDGASAIAYCRMMSEQHQDHDFEFRMIASDGRVVWIRDLVTVVVDTDQSVRLMGVMLDVTRQKEIEQRLRSSERNYREIFNATSDAIFIHGATTGRIVDVNAAALKLYGYQYDDLLLQDLNSLSLGESPYSAAEAAAYLQEAVKGGYPVFEWQARRKSGELFWAEVALRFAEIGGKQRVIAAVRDISERIAAQNELQRYRSHLEVLVAERTEQLRQAQESLVQKERLAVLGQLTTTVSHEVRNPLGTVMNALFLIRDLAEERQLQAMMRPLELAERNVQRCDSIISELLDFSKRRTVQKAVLELGSWLTTLLDELAWPEELICRRQVRPGCTVLADAERLRRALVNVLTNAQQALEEGAPEQPCLEIRLQQREGRCEIVVRDNGPGMSPEVMARIFEPMFSTKNFGVGLGVPIIKNIMEDHGGGVDYLSRPGEGTTVVLWLPSAEGEQP